MPNKTPEQLAMIEKARTWAYPTTPHVQTKGGRVYRRTRKAVTQNGRRQDYYFGEQDSVESIVLFQRWRQRVIDTGEVPLVEEVRIDSAHEDREPPLPITDDRKQAAHMGAMMAIAVIFGGIISVSIDRFLLLGRSPVVDGQELSIQEIDLIVGDRQHHANEERARQMLPSRAETNAMLMATQKSNPDASGSEMVSLIKEQIIGRVKDDLDKDGSMERGG